MYIPIVNVGTSDLLLYPRTEVGVLREVRVVSLPSGVKEVPSYLATVASQAVTSTLQDQVDAVNLSALSAEEREEACLLLGKYASVFSSHDGDLGCTNLIAHEIPLLDDTPIRQRYRRIPPSEYEVVKEHISQLLDAQVIRESCSPFASPIVLVKKKDGSLRLCVDYRQLNSRTRKDAFPLPRIEESLDALTGARWFSTMDLASGYNQVPVAEADRPKDSSNGIACLSGCVMHPARSSDSCNGFSEISNVSRCFCIWTILLSSPPPFSNILRDWKWCCSG